MLKLYYWPRTRSIRPRWMLEEIGVPYELVPINLKEKKHKALDYLKVHPHGAVPALSDGSHVFIESVAICAYLADHYGEGKFAPPLLSEDRGQYYQWLFYAVATLENPVFNFFLHTIRLPQEQRSAEIAKDAQSKATQCFQILEHQVKNKDYMVGHRFSTVDVVMGSILDWALAMNMFTSKEFPELVRYISSLKQRPAYSRARLDT